LSDVAPDLNQPRPRPKPTPATLKRDWAMSLTANGTSGSEMFPAKYTWDITAQPNCANDYVVFTTSLVGSSSVPSIVAFNNLYSTQGVAGGLCNTNGPSVLWAYKTNLSGDTTGTTVTSPVLELNGNYVAYVETRTNTNGGSVLHILKWKPGGEGALASPAAPDTTLAAGSAWNTSNCPAANSCIANLTFNGAQPDTNSAPFYDYTNDILYVGDDNGVLHKFTGVFYGTPAETVTCSTSPCTTAWPLTVHSSTKLSSPVYDANSGNILVGDAGAELSFVSTSAKCGSTSPPCLGTPIALGTGSIVDAPLVDGTMSTAFWFDGGYQTGTSTHYYGAVIQTSTSLTNKVVLTGVGGTDTPGSVMHVGAFDNNYIQSGPRATNYLYFCGKTNAHGDWPYLYRVGFSTSPTMNTTISGTPLSLAASSDEDCSPATEFYNGNTDLLFLSVGQHAYSWGTCTSTTGCIMTFTLGTNMPTTAASAVSAPPLSTGTGTTSGIVADTDFSVTAAWAASTGYPVGSLIVDGNSNVERVTACSGTCKSGTRFKFFK